MFNSTVFLFQLVTTFHSKLAILKPNNITEAFVVTDFNTNHITPKWPQDWRRMYLLNISDHNIFVDESDAHLKIFNKPILYYKLRLITINRTVLDFEWYPIIWNPDVCEDNYLSFLVILTLFCIVLFSVLFVFLYYNFKNCKYNLANMIDRFL